jgi:hypothetical protein
MVHINIRAVCFSVFAIMAILGGFCIALKVTENDTRLYELHSDQGFVKEMEISRGIANDKSLERLFPNDETIISIEKDKTLLAFHYKLNNEEKLDDSYQNFQDAYFKMIILNRENWAGKFLQSPKYDFKKGEKWHAEIPEKKGECIVKPIGKTNKFCIFVPLRDAFDGEDDLGDFYIRIYFYSLFELKDKLRTNRIIFNVKIPAGSNIPEHLKNNAGGFMVFFPMESEVSFTFGDPKLQWVPGVSSLACIYHPKLLSSPPPRFDSLNESFVIKVNSRSYFAAVWGLVTSIILSIIVGFMSIFQWKTRNSSAQGINLPKLSMKRKIRKITKLKVNSIFIIFVLFFIVLFFLFIYNYINLAVTAQLSMAIATLFLAYAAYSQLEEYRLEKDQNHRRKMIDFLKVFPPKVEGAIKKLPKGNHNLWDIEGEVKTRWHVFHSLPEEIQNKLWEVSRQYEKFVNTTLKSLIKFIEKLEQESCPISHVKFKLGGVYKVSFPPAPEPFPLIYFVLTGKNPSEKVKELQTDYILEEIKPRIEGEEIKIDVLDSWVCKVREKIDKNDEIRKALEEYKKIEKSLINLKETIKDQIKSLNY